MPSSPGQDGAPDAEALKRRAAEAAADEVRDGMVVGLGTGSTVSHLLEVLAGRAKAGLRFTGVPTSVRTESDAKRLGIPLTDLDQVEHLDVCIDGADEVTPRLDLTKGLGGALVREKVVAAAANRFVVIVDQSKVVPRLGTRSPIPVEVVPFAAGRLARVLGGHGPRLREKDGRPFVSDNGNHVLDLHTGPIADPARLARLLDRTPGIVDHGLFLGMAQAAYVAAPEGVRKILK